MGASEVDVASAVVWVSSLAADDWLSVGDADLDSWSCSFEVRLCARAASAA